MKVGRCDLLLLDSNIEGNRPEDRELTSRFMEEIPASESVRSCCWAPEDFVLFAHGDYPGVLHLNEGHSGFAVLEAVRSRMQDEGLTFDQAVPLEFPGK